MNNEKIVSIGAVVLVVGAIVGLAIFGGSKIKKPVVKAETVATVNGVVITKETYDTQLASAITAFKSQGINTDDAAQLAQIKTQVLNDLISNELVNQGVAKSGITITDEDIQKQVDTLVTQVGGAENFKEQLTAANLTEEQLRANISRQLAIQAYLLKNIDITSATVTDAEIKKFYDDSTKDQTNVPAFKDVSEQIKQQLIAQKQQVLINAFVQTLRANAQVETSTNL